MSLNPKCWRAPKWSPLWLRRAFPGCWTQAEIDDIRSRARARRASVIKNLTTGDTDDQN